MSVELKVVVGKNLLDGKSVGRYKFNHAPSVGETISIDSEQGDPSENQELVVDRVLHFPLSLEAPMGNHPTITQEYAILLCTEQH